MTDTNKKRGSSFRKIFPNIFFSNKSKEKISTKNSNIKLNTDCGTSRSNHYQNPQTVFARHDNQVGGPREHDDRIYENLSNTSFVSSVNNSSNMDMLSNHSSNSTLVSDNVKNQKHQSKATLYSNEINDVKYMARPQVPPKPQNETYAPLPYSDVYYHSLDKLSNKISPLDEIEIYNASKTHTQPASVGAEIKKVSTKFLISPKKEADVRIIQPTRARSLSPIKEKPKNIEPGPTAIEKDWIVEKPYNYSAPTSPVAISHKIPNMPTTVSPYEHVRKTMIEAEEKRNSVNRSLRNKFISTPSSTNVCKSPLMSVERRNIEEFVKKEKTRQKVEAFYWQKIKELKQKEDEYLLKQSLNSPVGESKIYNRNYSNSNCSAPNTYITDPRSFSLSRRVDNSINQAMYSSPHLIRGAPERRTDSYITSHTYRKGTDVIYRNPEKLVQNTHASSKLPSVQNMSTVVINRIGSERQDRPDSQANNSIRKRELFRVKLDFDDQDYRNSPQELRTASVTSSISSYLLPMNNRNNSKSTIRSMCSESESGSEVGEIQRIMENRSQKGKQIFLVDCL